MPDGNFEIGIWDHCRYVTDRNHPYDEMARHLEQMRGCGVSISDIYLPEVISLDDYCRAAKNCGMRVEARITPAWAAPNAVVRRTLPDNQWLEMESRFGIRLAGPCGNRADNRERFVQAATHLVNEFFERLDSIQLDFIRNDNALLLQDYPCCCDECRKLYRRFFGCELLGAKELATPSIQYKLVALRCENIERTVRDMHEITQRNGLKLSVAARANYANSADISSPPVWGLGPALLEGQDWVRWSDLNLVENISTMNYHPDLALFFSTLADHRRLLEGRAVEVLTPGIGVESSMGKISAAKVAERLKLTKESGLPGAKLFNKSNLYDREYRAVISDFAKSAHVG